MITNLKVFPCFTSKGSPSIRVKVYTSEASFSALVPSGTSKSKHEVVELPYEKIRKIFPSLRKELIGREANWKEIDRFLIEWDGTSRFQRIGGNLALGISISVARAQTRGELWKLQGLPTQKFPLPLSNVIGGGKHGGKTTWQEFLLLPIRAKNPYEAFQSVLEVWKVIGEELRRKKLLLGRNIENAWISELDDFQTLEFLSQFASDWDMRLGIDFAASSFWTGKTYAYKSLGKSLSLEKHFELVREVAEKYKVYYLEDPFHEEDFSSFTELRKKFPNKLIVGDDLYSTRRDRLEEGIQRKSTTGIIIKPNQCGTLLQTRETLELAKSQGILPVISHRSGETEDPWLADLSLAWETPITKIGVLNPDLPKQNRFLELWEEVPKPEMAKI